MLFGVLAYLVHHFLLVPVLLLALADGAIAATARSLATAARIEILRPGTSYTRATPWAASPSPGRSWPAR